MELSKLGALWLYSFEIIVVVSVIYAASVNGDTWIAAMTELSASDSSRKWKSLLIFPFAVGE